MIPFFVIMFVDNPLIQIIPLQVLFLLTIYILLFVKPFRKKTQNLFLAFVDFIYLLIFSAFLLLKLLEDKISQKTKYTKYGFLVIGLISLLMLTYFLVAIASVIKGCKKKCKKGKSKAVVGPEAEFGKFMDKNEAEKQK